MKTVQLTVERARELALIFCQCGHPHNNHFDSGSCAHCDCKALVETRWRDGIKEVPTPVTACTYGCGSCEVCMKEFEELLDSAQKSRATRSRKVKGK